MIPPCPDQVERFRQCYRENYRPLVGFARRRTSTPEDAADVVAETFLVAWRRLEAVPTGPEARLWLFGTARLVISNHRRTDRRRERLAARLGFELVRGPVESPDVLDAVAGRRAFSLLGEADQEILRLSAWEGLGVPELAAVLGCSRGAAKVRLFRARHRLTDHLRQFDEDPEPPNAQTRAADPACVAGGHHANG
jgi:RNA polymerase sigma-70 factor (ECF subfamily)